VRLLGHVPLLFLTLGFGSAQAAWWVPVLTCDNGKARVEVDLGERRNVQIVITDPNIRDHFTKSGVRDFYGFGGGDSVGGRVNEGIFYSSQFRGFVRQGASPTCHSGFAATFKVDRVGNGLTVVANQEAAEGCCWESDSYGTCYKKGADIPFREMANWYFRSCQEVAIPN
jgi:hypothetical protein